MNSARTTQFHASTTIYNGIVPQIKTKLFVLEAFDPFQLNSVPSPTSIEVDALWDTGATGSVITQEIVNNLKLKPVGKTNIRHAGGMSSSNTYLVNFILPNKVQIIGILASECSDLVGNFKAIIGMDVITKGDFSITNVENKTCMSFRIPSIVRIDYVKEANRLLFQGVGRNDPCPCGQVDAGGKPIKFKNCHGKKNI